MTIRYIPKSRKKQTDAPELELGFRTEFRKYDWSKKHNPPFRVICSETIYELFRKKNIGFYQCQDMLQKRRELFIPFGKREQGFWYFTDELKQYLKELGIEYE